MASQLSKNISFKLRGLEWSPQVLTIIENILIVAKSHIKIDSIFLFFKFYPGLYLYLTGKICNWIVTYTDQC